MKNLITLVLVFSITLCNAQDFIFGGNITNQRDINMGMGETNKVYGNFRFNFGLSTYYIGFEAGDTDYSENIINYEWKGFKLLVWSESSFYEVYYAPMTINRKPVMVIEHPYIGEVEYRQYYQSPNMKILEEPLIPVKPVMSGG